jgi:tetratricopeptide (TPR) repeat protein
MTDLAQDAINQALSGCWEKAVETNKLILNTDPDDTDALNRLARAYAELGNLTQARLACQKVLKIDKFNSIASRSLEKWKELKKGDISSSPPSDPRNFIEEPGKTKIVSLINLGSGNILAKLDAGDEVKLDMHSHRASVTTDDNKYIGRLPDDLSARLKKLSLCGNEYKAYIKSSDSKEVKVFIREEKRDKKVSNVPSFTSERIEYVSFTPPELVHDKEELNTSEEDDEQQ